MIARLRRRLDQLDQSLRLDRKLGQTWVSDTWEELQGALAGLTAARRAAHVNARVVPRWWLRRAAIDAEIRRTEELDHVAISVFGVMRLADTMPRDTALPSSLRAAIAEMDRELAGAGDTWPS
jgi:hypothetical protein